METAGFVIDDVVERGPYAPEVEYQSRRAYIFARKLHSLPGGLGIEIWRTEPLNNGKVRR